jgi:hypothetical protein
MVCVNDDGVLDLERGGWRTAHRPATRGIGGGIGEPAPSAGKSLAQTIGFRTVASFADFVVQSPQVLHITICGGLRSRRTNGSYVTT